VRRAACACSPCRRRQCQARRRRPRFAAFVDLRPELAPPGAPRCRAAPPQPLPVAGRSPVRRRRLGPSRPPLTLRRRYSPLRFRLPLPMVSSSLKPPRPPLSFPQLNRAPGFSGRRRRPPEPRPPLPLPVECKEEDKATLRLAP
jgi:hypothetical protein